MAILNVWSTNWNGHNVEVHNHWFKAELHVDGKCIDDAGGLFGCQLRGKIHATPLGECVGMCPDPHCKHANRAGAKYCAVCGEKIGASPSSHDVRAEISSGLFSPVCRIFVDGAQVFKDGF